MKKTRVHQPAISIFTHTRERERLEKMFLSWTNSFFVCMRNSNTESFQFFLHLGYLYSLFYPSITVTMRYQEQKETRCTLRHQLPFFFHRQKQDPPFLHPTLPISGRGAKIFGCTPTQYLHFLLVFFSPLGLFCPLPFISPILLDRTTSFSLFHPNEKCKTFS